MILAILSFSREDKASCARHMARITTQLRPLLSSYYDSMHDKKIAQSAWLSHVQGFYAWGVGYFDDISREWVKFDGLSGNQVLLFQALDAFIGIEPYLSIRDQERNMPIRQRVFCRSLEKHSFRTKLSGNPNDGAEAEIAREFEEIIKRLRVSIYYFPGHQVEFLMSRMMQMFRSAHRTRAKAYLSQPAPERLPMTAGKSLLKSDTDQSLQFLDGFMIGRLAQTK